jgi:hypothetical protein
LCPFGVGCSGWSAANRFCKKQSIKQKGVHQTMKTAFSVFVAALTVIAGYFGVRYLTRNVRTHLET